MYCKCNLDISWVIIILILLFSQATFSPKAYEPIPLTPNLDWNASKLNFKKLLFLIISNFHSPNLCPIFFHWVSTKFESPPQHNTLAFLFHFSISNSSGYNKILEQYCCHVWTHYRLRFLHVQAVHNIFTHHLLKKCHEKKTLQMHHIHEWDDKYKVSPKKI
jgi:hypothetical protein